MTRAGTLLMQRGVADNIFDQLVGIFNWFYRQGTVNEVGIRDNLNKTSNHIPFLDLKERRFFMS